MNEKILQKKLKKSFVAASLIGLLIVVFSIATVAILNHSLNQMTLEEMKTETEEYSRRIQQQIKKNFQILQTFAVFLGDFNLNDQTSFAESLQDANEKNDFLSMGYFDKSGEGVLATLGQDVKKNIPNSSLNGEVREVVSKALSGEQTVSGVFDSRVAEARIFVYGVPVYQNGEVTGTLTASDRMNDFADILTGSNTLSGNGYLHLIESDGTFLIRSSRSVIQEEADSVFDGSYFSQKEQERIRQTMEEGESLFSSFHYQGKDYQVFLQPVGVNHWYLLCVNTREEISGAAYQMVRITVVTLVCILILSLLLLVFSYRLLYSNNRALNRLAYQDGLTGADNLQRFRQTLTALCEKKGARGSVAALNVRQFKFINEIFGREFADQLLCRIKENIQENLELEEFFCRDNGDLFYVYLKDTDRERVRTRIEHILQQVSHSSLSDHKNYQVLMYAGVVIFDEENVYRHDRGDALLTHVLFALATAKTLPSNSVWFYDKERHKAEELENYVESHMHQALEKQEFRLFLQPKFDLNTNRLAGAEALVRWITEEGRMIFPNQFIPLFEENGFCVQLDFYMVEQACRQIRQWLNAGITPIPISINQSKRLFYETDYIENLRSLTEKYEIPATLITLEILEGLAMENVEELNQKIGKLQELGFRVSMDDFGSGYSSLNTLGNLNIDELKLDQGFLFAIAGGQGERFKLIMEKVVSLTKSLHISTVVEGVETEEDEALIKSLGCDLGQGYYYSRPISAVEFNKKYMEAQKDES